MEFNPDIVVFHHTGVPSLAQRPTGFTAQHIRNLRDYYLKEKGWPSTPHYFVDDKQVWLLTPAHVPGTHCRGHNGHTIGIEVLGNYNEEDPESGRGLACWQNAVVLYEYLHLAIPPIQNYAIHRDLSSTDCPGKKVSRAFIDRLLADPNRITTVAVSDCDERDLDESLGDD